MVSQLTLPGFDTELIEADASCGFAVETLPVRSVLLVNPVDAPETVALITSGVIAAELRQPRSRVKRVLASRADIRPLATAGRTRLYSAVVIARVRYELNAMDARLARRVEKRNGGGR